MLSNAPCSLYNTTICFLVSHGKRALIHNYICMCPEEFQVEAGILTSKL